MRSRSWSSVFIKFISVCPVPRTRRGGTGKGSGVPGVAWRHAEHVERFRYVVQVRRAGLGVLPLSDAHHDPERVTQILTLVKPEVQHRCREHQRVDHRRRVAGASQRGTNAAFRRLVRGEDQRHRSVEGRRSNGVDRGVVDGVSQGGENPRPRSVGVGLFPDKRVISEVIDGWRRHTDEDDRLVGPELEDLIAIRAVRRALRDVRRFGYQHAEIRRLVDIPGIIEISFAVLLCPIHRIRPGRCPHRTRPDRAHF